MNVYKKMLVKLFEATGGKDSKRVDLKELVKKEGFLPSYSDIYKHLNQQGWITEAGRSDVVCITHWGAKEAKKAQSGVSDGSREIKKRANNLTANIKELQIISEEFSNDISEEGFKRIKDKFGEIEKAIEKLESNF